MIESAIVRSLQKAIMAAVAASIVPSLPVKYIGRSFASPNDNKWLELVFIPNNGPDMFWQGQQYSGMFRMILHWPNDDLGAYSPLDTIASIAGYFYKGMSLPSVTISSNPTLTSVLEQGSENLWPASLRYFSSEIP
jgi:hypothetical protein